MRVPAFRKDALEEHALGCLERTARTPRGERGILLLYFDGVSSADANTIYNEAADPLFQYARGNRAAAPRQAKKAEPPPAKGGPR
jgi:hypothetical protein